MSLPLSTSIATPTIPTIPNPVDSADNALLDIAGEIDQWILAVTMLVAGLFVAFLGARFFKHIVFFVGFLLGGVLAYYAVPEMFSWFDSSVAADTLLYITLAMGALCGVLLVVVYKAAVFSCGAICGAILSQIIWIGVVSNAEVPDEDYMAGVQVGVLVGAALLGGWLAFKFVEQVLKAVTAFIGGFMFASGVAFCLSELDSADSRNVVDWVVFFGSWQSYRSLDDVCDAYCIVCIVLWLALFAVGCFVQYKLHKTHRRKDHDDDDEEYSDSDDSEEDEDGDEESIDYESRKTAKKKKERDIYEEGPPSEYGSQFGGAASYAGSVRGVNQFGGALVGSASTFGPGSLGAPGQGQAHSEYGASYYNPHAQVQMTQQPTKAHSAQYGGYGQRAKVHYAT